jgi:hypothetical protein
VRYPNLEWAASFHRLRRFELAQLLKISEGAFCNRLSGRVLFSPIEKQRLAERLGYTSEWLFQQMVPPVSARLHRPEPAQVSI